MRKTAILLLFVAIGCGTEPKTRTASVPAKATKAKATKPKATEPNPKAIKIGDRCLIVSSKGKSRVGVAKTPEDFALALVHFRSKDELALGVMRSDGRFDTILSGAECVIIGDSGDLFWIELPNGKRWWVSRKWVKGDK